MYRARPGGRLHKISSGIKKRKGSLNSALEILRQNKRAAFSCLASFQSKTEHQGLFTSQLCPSSTFDAIISGEGKQERIQNPTSLFLYPSEPRSARNKQIGEKRKKENELPYSSHLSRTKTWQRKRGKEEKKGIDRYRPLLGEPSFPDIIYKKKNISPLTITGPSDRLISHRNPTVLLQ